MCVGKKALIAISQESGKSYPLESKIFREISCKPWGGPDYFAREASPTLLHSLTAGKCPACPAAHLAPQMDGR